jgi:hypothetical protein
VSAFSFYPPPDPAPPFDWRQTVISQYANSPTLLALIEDWAEDLEQSDDYDSFYNLIWNVLTAQGYGLDIWGQIVGVVRALFVSTDKFFGFEQETNTTADTFGPGGVSPFFTGGTPTNNFMLSDTAFRQLILAKAAANICDGSIPALNAILLMLFGQGYVTNGEDMTMTYTFPTDLSPVDLAIAAQSGVLPTPAGVSSTIIEP